MASPTSISLFEADRDKLVDAVVHCTDLDSLKALIVEIFGRPTRRSVEEEGGAEAVSSPAVTRSVRNKRIDAQLVGVGNTGPNGNPQPQGGAKQGGGRTVTPEGTKGPVGGAKQAGVGNAKPKGTSATQGGAQQAGGATITPKGPQGAVGGAGQAGGRTTASAGTLRPGGGAGQAGGGTTASAGTLRSGGGAGQAGGGTTASAGTQANTEARASLALLVGIVKSASGSSPSDNAESVPGAAGEAASASSESASGSGLGDKSSFSTALSKNAQKKARKDARLAQEASEPRAPAQSPGPVTMKQKPLVLKGASEELQASPLKVWSALRGLKDNVARTVTTKRGTVLVFPKTQEDVAILLDGELPDGLSLRETRSASKPKGDTKHVVVLLGVSPGMADDELAEHFDRPCKRILSAQQSGSATYKVKVTCRDEADRLRILKEGLDICGKRHRATDYKGMRPALQCIKCLAFGHVASVCEGEEKCRKCGEGHNWKVCEAGTKRCANCNGDHEASDFRCPKFVAETRKAEVAKLSYAQAVSKGGEQLDCVRLACSFARTLDAVLSRLGLDQKLKHEELCEVVAKSVASSFKADVRGDHVHHIAFVARGSVSPS